MGRLKSYSKRMVISLALVFGLSITSLSCFAEVKIVTSVVEGNFAEVAANVRGSIIGKGIHIAHILPASSMLKRTGGAYGYQNDVYQHAEIYEFCSASLSHKLSRADPENIMLCPFTVSVYVLNGETNKVRISYRIPEGKPGAESIVSEIVALLESIVEDATW